MACIVIGVVVLCSCYVRVCEDVCWVASCAFRVCECVVCVCSRVVIVLYGAVVGIVV